MTWSSPDSWVSWLLSGDPVSILLAFVVSVSVPVLLHFFLYPTSSKSRSTPSFVLLGPVGGGKTSFFATLQAHQPASAIPQHTPLTRTSQTYNRATLSLPANIKLGSNKYRSENDSSLQASNKDSIRYQLTDTPGHRKLRAERALPHLDEQSLKGIIYMVDSASLADSNDAGSLKDTCSYLHDVLLYLQRRKTRKGSRKKSDVCLLIAANKQDLFQALPEGAVKQRLENGIERMRQSQRSGLHDVGDDRDYEDTDNVLLEGIAKEGQPFTFQHFEDECGIQVKVLGGATRDDEEMGRGTDKWTSWIGSNL